MPLNGNDLHQNHETSPYFGKLDDKKKRIIFIQIHPADEKLLIQV